MFIKSSKLLVLFSVVILLVSGVLFAAAAEDYSMSFECDSSSNVDENNVWNGVSTETISIDSGISESVIMEQHMGPGPWHAVPGRYFVINAPCGARVIAGHPGVIDPHFHVGPHGPHCAYRFYGVGHPAVPHVHLSFNWGSTRQVVQVNFF